ncbi:MAG: hypothetical protein GTO18_05805 [Anaerolineales bacterium]|nr:hypothetical protein [Anaerolineales bacterium]
MVENRWQIAIGAVILIMMLMVGSFSLGVYFGRNGISREAPRTQQVQNPLPKGNPAPVGPMGLPQGRPDVIGRLCGYSEGQVEMATEEGIRRVFVNKDTQLIDTEGKPLEPDDFEIGDMIAVFGELSINDGQQLLASFIVRIPDQAPRGG